jgi:hypothetical protein
MNCPFNQDCSLDLYQPDKQDYSPGRHSMTTRIVPQGLFRMSPNCLRMTTRIGPQAITVCQTGLVRGPPHSMKPGLVPGAPQHGNQDCPLDGHSMSATFINVLYLRRSKGYYIRMSRWISFMCTMKLKCRLFPFLSDKIKAR